MTLPTSSTRRRRTRLSTAAVGSVLAATGPGRHDRAPGPVRGEACRGGTRVGERDRCGARDPERRDRLEGQEPCAETGAVTDAPDWERKLGPPPLGNLSPQLRQGNPHKPGFAGRGQDGQRGDAEGELSADQGAESAEQRADERGRDDRPCREAGECDPLTALAPAHGGSEGLHH